MEIPVVRGVLEVGIEDERELIVVIDLGASEEATAVTAAAGDDDTAAVATGVSGPEGVDNMVD
jgi:hypothetical protein